MFMGVYEEFGELERKLRTLIKKDNLEQAADIVIANAKEAMKLTSKILPKQAFSVQRQKYETRYSGCYSYSSEEEKEELERLYKDEFEWEKELLEAQHPRRVARLWAEAKPKLEQRYGRKLKSRKDLAIMNEIFESMRLFDRELDSMKKSLKKAEKYKTRAAETPGIGWEEVSNLWRKGYLNSEVKTCASHLLTLVRDAANPYYMVREEKSDPDWDDIDGEGITNRLTSPVHHSPSKRFNDFWFNVHHEFLEPSFYYIEKIILAHKQGKLSFKKAMHIIEPRFTKESDKGKLFPAYIRSWDWLDEVRDAALDSLKTYYAKRKTGDSCSKFLEQYSKIILGRWKDTAVDYDRLFDFHKLDSSDKELVALFYRIKHGKADLSEYSEKIHTGRLPALLREMMDDNIIDLIDVEPPLKKTYLKPEQVIATGKKRIEIPKELEQKVFSSFQAATPLIEGGKAEIRLLPEKTGEKFPMQSDPLSELANAIEDKSAPYYVVYKGDSTALIAAEVYYPGGQKMFTGVHRLSLLKEGAEPKYGKVITIDGQRFLLKTESEAKEYFKNMDLLADANKDLTSIKSLNVVLDISPEEFKQKYFRDFMAVVLAYSDGIGDTAPDVMSRMDSIDELMNDVISVKQGLGAFHRTVFSTFEFSGKFAFQLIYVRPSWREPGQILEIAPAILAYIDELGIPKHVDVVFDESSRDLAEHKKEQRKFQEEHLDEIVSALQGQGLVKVLSFVVTDKDYSLHSFGPSREPCEHCGQTYFQGEINKITPGSGDKNRVWAHELHALANHPQT
jgi:hypothetical protein